MQHIPRRMAVLGLFQNPDGFSKYWTGIVQNIRHLFFEVGENRVNRTGSVDHCEAVVFYHFVELRHYSILVFNKTLVHIVAQTEIHP